VLGLVCAALGAYGAFEFAHKLEGGTVTYLVLAAPVIAVTAALIPPIAEVAWRSGHSLKALLWWAVLVPAGAVVLVSASERVHVAKAGAEAERSAYRNAATRAQAALTKSEASLAKARAEANAARAQKQCGPICRTKLSAEATAQADVDAARRELLSAESRATTDSPLQAPVWLLPAALDLVAFMATWTGLTGRAKPTQRVVPRKRRAVRRRARVPETPDANARAAALVRRGANDNKVVPFTAA
jgi:hypothetical protein